MVQLSINGSKMATATEVTGHIRLGAAVDLAVDIFIVKLTKLNWWKTENIVARKTPNVVN